MTIPSVYLGLLDNATALIDIPQNEKVAIISSKTSSGIDYFILVFLNKTSALNLIDLMTKEVTKYDDLQNLSPLDTSLIKELGSILILKYVEALNSFLNVESLPGPPIFRVDSVHSIKDYEFHDYSKNINEIITINFLNNIFCT